MAMSLVLGVALGMSTLLLKQFTALRGLGYSSLALQAADAGIEKIFYDSKTGVDVRTECPCTQTLANGASYIVTIDVPGTNGCPATATSYCAKSVGTFQSVRRAIRIAR